MCRWMESCNNTPHIHGPPRKSLREVDKSCPDKTRWLYLVVNPPSESIVIGLAELDSTDYLLLLTKQNQRIIHGLGLAYVYPATASFYSTTHEW